MKKQKFISDLKTALQLCKKHKGLFLLSMFLEIVFYLVIAVSQFWVLLAARDSILRVMDLIQESVGSLAEADAISVASPELFRTPELMAEYHIILKYFLVLIGIFFLTWIIFKGLTWFIAHKMLKKVDVKKFTWFFVLYSLLTFIFSFIWFVLIMRLISYSTFAFLPLIGVAMDRILLFVGFAVIAYFMLIAYSLIPNAGCRKICQFSVSKFRQLIPSYLLWLVSLTILSYLTVWVISINYWAPVIFALFITIPAFVYGRIYILVVVNKVVKRGR